MQGPAALRQIPWTTADLQHGDPVGCQFFQKTAEGADVPETAFGSQAHQRVVSYRFQEIDLVRIDRDTAELGDINEYPTDTAHSYLLA